MLVIIVHVRPHFDVFTFSALLVARGGLRSLIVALSGDTLMCARLGYLIPFPK